MRIQEGLLIQNDERTTNPYLILAMDEEEEPDDEEIEDKIHEMQVVSPQRSPRRPAEKQTERDDASVGSMRCPSTRGKHETEGSKRNQEGVREEEMQVPEGRKEGGQLSGRRDTGKRRRGTWRRRRVYVRKHIKKRYDRQGYSGNGEGRSDEGSGGRQTIRSGRGV
jgi:hypothetical protein